MARVFTQPRRLGRLALVVDPDVRRAVVVGVMLCVFAHYVSFKRILSHQRIKDANTVTTILPNEAQLNEVACHYQGSALKLDSILSVLKDLIFLEDPIIFDHVSRAHPQILYAPGAVAVRVVAEHDVASAARLGLARTEKANSGHAVVKRLVAEHYVVRARTV